MYLLQSLQRICVDFSDVVGFCCSIIILTNRVDTHQAVVCDLNTLEVSEKPATEEKTGKDCSLYRIVTKKKRELGDKILQIFENFETFLICFQIVHVEPTWRRYSCRDQDMRMYQTQ